MIIAVTGSTGLVGSALVPALEADGQLMRRIVRGPVRDAVHEIHWDPAAGKIDARELNGLDAVVHLAGENIAGRRWSADFKRQILDSRVEGTQLLCGALAGLEMKPSVLVSASATGFYGSRGEELVDESSVTGSGFLADVCRQWEAATAAAQQAGIRVVNLRIGPVLSPAGGALAKMLPPFKAGVGGVVGSGKQYLSWIALDDVVAAIIFALKADKLRGAVNAVAPQAVTNYEFSKTLGRVLGRPTVFPMPAFAARLAFGEMADEMVLASIHVAPRVLENSGFTFAYPQLEPALRHLLSRDRSPQALPHAKAR
jgi:uncharacterized protein (TIGR01777 family)